MAAVCSAGKQLEEPKTPREHKQDAPDIHPSVPFKPVSTVPELFILGALVSVAAGPQQLLVLS